MLLTQLSRIVADAVGKGTVLFVLSGRQLMARTVLNVMANLMEASSRPGHNLMALYFEDVIETLGGKVVKSSGRGKCCGFPILTSNEANSLQMCGDHTIDAKQKGAVTLITPCPLCHLELDGKQADAAAHRGEDINMPILHLPQLIGLALVLLLKRWLCRAILCLLVPWKKLWVLK